MPSPSDDDDIELLEEMPWTASSTRIRTLTNGGTTQGQNLPQIKRIDAEVNDSYFPLYPVSLAHWPLLTLPDRGYRRPDRLPTYTSYRTTSRQTTTFASGSVIEIELDPHIAIGPLYERIQSDRLHWKN